MVVFLHERVEVLGAQPGPEKEYKRGAPGRAMSLKNSGSEDVLPSTFCMGVSPHLQTLFLKPQLLPNMCPRRRKMGRSLPAIEEKEFNIVLLVWYQ